MLGPAGVTMALLLALGRILHRRLRPPSLPGRGQSGGLQQYSAQDRGPSPNLELLTCVLQRFPRCSALATPPGRADVLSIEPGGGPTAPSGSSVTRAAATRDACLDHCPRVLLRALLGAVPVGTTSPGDRVRGGRCAEVAGLHLSGLGLQLIPPRPPQTPHHSLGASDRP